MTENQRAALEQAYRALDELSTRLQLSQNHGGIYLVTIPDGPGDLA